MTTRIRRERHRPLWQRAGVQISLLLVALGLGLTGLAWHLGGPVPVGPMAVSLPEREVSVAAASTGVGE